MLRPLLLALAAVEAAASGLLKLRSLDIVSGIRMRFATTKVRVVVDNPGPLAQLYHFVSYLPGKLRFV